MKKYLILLGFALLTACNTRPDCTIEETAGGQFIPYGDCDNCDQLSVINGRGDLRRLTAGDAERYINQYPPSANYNPSSPSLSDFMLYSMLLNGPRANHYSTVYVQQARSYSGYRRANPGYVAPRRFVRPTTVVNRTTIVNNRTVRSTPPTNRRPAQPVRSSGFTSTPTRTYSSSRSSSPARSSGFSSSSSRSSGRSSSSSSSRRR